MMICKTILGLICHPAGGGTFMTPAGIQFKRSRPGAFRLLGAIRAFGGGYFTFEAGTEPVNVKEPRIRLPPSRGHYQFRRTIQF